MVHKFKAKGGNLKVGVLSFALQKRKEFSQRQVVSKLQNMYFAGKCHQNATNMDRNLKKNTKEYIIKVYCYLGYIYRQPVIY